MKKLIAAALFVLFALACSSSTPSIEAPEEPGDLVKTSTKS